jgi:hypothetical protein
MTRAIIESWGFRAFVAVVVALAIQFALNQSPSDALWLWSVAGCSWVIALFALVQAIWPNESSFGYALEVFAMFALFSLALWAFGVHVLEHPRTYEAVAGPALGAGAYALFAYEEFTIEYPGRAA